MADNYVSSSAQSNAAGVEESQKAIRAIQIKLQRLLDGYLEQDIEREVYREQKASLLSEKKSLEEDMSRIDHQQHDWLEPFLKWLNVATNLVRIARDHDLGMKKVMAKEIFGSNLRLAARRLLGNPVGPWSFALQARQAAADFSERSILVSLLYQTRTYFQNK